MPLFHIKLIARFVLFFVFKNGGGGGVKFSFEFYRNLVNVISESDRGRYRKV